MSKWQKVKIGDFLFERQGRYKPNDRIVSNLKRIKKIDFSGTFFIGDKPSRTDMILVRKGDFVISGINVAKGAMGIYREEDDITATIHYSSYTFDEKKIDIDYFEHFLSSSEFVRLLEKKVKGGIKTEIKAKHLLPLEIILPDLDTQREIAQKLFITKSKHQTLSNKNFFQQSQLALLRQQILQDAVSGKLTADWRKKNPDIESANKLLKKIKVEKEKLIMEKKNKKEKPLPVIADNEIPFDLPEKWEWVRLNKLGNFFTGNSINETIKKTKYSKINIGYPYIGTKDVYFNGAGINYDSGVKIPFDEKSFKIAKINTILFCIEGGSSGKKYAITNQVACFGNKLLASSITDLVDISYVYSFYQSRCFADQFKVKSKGLRGGVSVSKFKEILIALPPLAEQKVIVAKMEKLIEKVSKLEEKIKQNKQDVETLMQSFLVEAFKN